MADAHHDLHRLEVLGFEMLPRPHPHSPGFGGVSLVLPRHAAGHDPEVVILTVVDWQGRPHATHLHADVSPSQSHRVAPGRVYLRSRLETEAAFYTFGADLAVETLPAETILTLTSEAPLLELAPEEMTPVNLLATETDVLLGRMEVEEARASHGNLMQRLIAVGPLELYLAVLQSLLALYDGAGALAHLRPDLTALLRGERAWYAETGRWPIIQPDLPTLLRSHQGER